MTTTTLTTNDLNRVRVDDLRQHIEDDLQVNALRDGKLVEVCWNDLTPEERRAAYCTTFGIYD